MESRILVARESPRRRLYAAGIGPETYLYRYQPEEDAFINLSLKLPFNYSEGFEVHDLSVDRRGIVWLATTDGLLRYDLERIRRVELGAYTETEVRAVAALGEGELWLSTSTAGLLHYQEADQQCTVFNQDSGLPSNVGAYRCLQVGADGRIWVGTAEGTVYSRDTQPRPLSTTAPILLHAYVNGKRQRVQPQLELPHRSKLKLDWAVPVYPSRGVAYRYRLRPGADSTWISLNIANQMTLPPLTAGYYEWTLQARRPGGYTWSPPLTLSVEVFAPWYKRWWAIVLWVMAGIGLIYLFERYVIGRLLRRIRVLEERLRMRDRRIEEQEYLLEEQSAGLAQQESDLLAMSQLQPAQQPHALPVAFLHYVSTRLDGRGDWGQMVGLLHQGIEHHSTCDALDICWYESDELQCLRLRTDENRPRLHAEAFDEKSSLPVWVLAQQSTLCLNDCAEEYEKVVSSDTPPPFGAALLVRSEVPGKQPFVLSFMAKRRQAFSPADQQVAELLAARLSAATRQPLTQNRWL